MSGLLQLVCPSCGSKLEASENDNIFNCTSCGNGYLIKQEGNSISLLPNDNDPQSKITGDNNIVISVKNVLPSSTTNEGQQSTISHDRESSPPEMMACPICGKYGRIENTFKCKECGRNYICLTHQDQKSYLGTECVNNLKNENDEDKSSQEPIFSIPSKIAALSGSLLIIIAYFLPWVTARGYVYVNNEMEHNPSFSAFEISFQQLAGRIWSPLLILILILSTIYLLLTVFFWWSNSKSTRIGSTLLDIGAFIGILTFGQIPANIRYHAYTDPQIGIWVTLIGLVLINFAGFNQILKTNQKPNTKKLQFIIWRIVLYVFLFIIISISLFYAAEIWMNWLKFKELF